MSSYLAFPPLPPQFYCGGKGGKAIPYGIGRCAAYWNREGWISPIPLHTSPCVLFMNEQNRVCAIFFHDYHNSKTVVAVYLCCTFPEVAFGGRYPLSLPCGARTFLMNRLSPCSRDCLIYSQSLFYISSQGKSTPHRGLLRNIFH